MPVTKGQLNLAAWSSIAMASLSIPIFLIAVFTAIVGGLGGRLIQAILTLVSLGLFVYVFWSLRKLLNSRFQFHETDRYILVLIFVSATVSALSVLSLPSEDLSRAVGVLAAISLIPYGITTIVFGIMILRLPDNLFGYLRPFSYTSIASGVCYSTVVLFPLGIIVSVVTYVIVGMTFFRASEALREETAQ